MKQLHAPIRSTLLAALVLLVLPEVARAQSDFDWTAIEDQTGHDGLPPLDLSAVHEAPSFAEEHGLVGAPTFEIRRNYVYVHDADGTLPVPFRTVPAQRDMDLSTCLVFAIRQLMMVEPDEFVFTYVFTSFRTGYPGYFYKPIKNTTQGIGFPFVRGGASPLEGYVFMNYWLSFEETFGRGGADLVRGQSRFVFNQEAGHRWGAYVQTATRARGRDVLRGRMQAHWSYFLDTNGSPMEGNAWRDNGSGTFTTVTGYDNWKYSELDLYLMGLIPPAEVHPFFVITNPMTMGARDITGAALNIASPPQAFGRPVTIGGRRVSVRIEDVISQNGMRSPPAGEAPNRFRVAFVLLASKAQPLSERERVTFETMVDGFAAGFKEGTGNRAELDNALTPTPKLPIGATCIETPQCDAAQSTICLTIPPLMIGAGLCTKACSAVSDCPQDWCCQAASSGVKVCLKQDFCEPEPPPDAGFPDAEPADTGTSPDAGAGPMVCACDTTTGCDKDSHGNQCPCDQDCKGDLQADHGGCLCVAPRASSGEGTSFSRALAGSLIFVFAGGATLLRRRRYRLAKTAPRS